MEGTPPTIFGDGRQSRDFTYIDNVVQANLKACTAPRAPGQVINVAGGKSYDLLYLLQVLRELLGSRVEPRFGPPRPGDVRYSLADLARARDILGYRVEVAFEEGLRRLVDLAREGKYLS
jgi:UDP-glucose 4-epimerase